MSILHRQYTTIQTHTSTSVSASGVSPIVLVGTEGFAIGSIVGRSSGSATFRVEATFSDGTRMSDGGSRIVSISGTTGAFSTFNLNGLKSISVYAVDTSAAANTITIEVNLMN